MLIASHFILNRTSGPQMPLHPWIHNFSNHYGRNDQVYVVLCVGVWVCACVC